MDKNTKDLVTILNDKLNQDKGGQMTDEQVRWADEHASTHIAYYSKRKCDTYGWFVCMECYSRFSMPHANFVYNNGTDSTAVCPHCGRKLRVIPSRKMTQDVLEYCSFIENINGIRVQRIWVRKCYHNARFKEQRHMAICSDPLQVIRDEWCEVMRRWEVGDNEYIDSTLGITSFIYTNRIPWALSTPIEVYDTAKQDSCRYYAIGETLYAATHSPQCPIVVERNYEVKYILPIVSKLTTDSTRASVRRSIMSRASRLPMIETLVKRGWVKEAKHIATHTLTIAIRGKNNYGDYNYKDFTGIVLNALRICIKNNYRPLDISLYVDYLIDLYKRGLPVSEPHYICAPDIIERHNATVREEQARRRQMREEMAHREAEQASELKRRRNIEKNNIYHDAHKPYLDIAFASEDKTLDFHVIQNVEELDEEGAKMHHCVAMYWERNNSLILSCRDHETNTRKATIEVNLNTFEIVQTRAACNAIPERRSYIDQTILDHMDEIIQASESAKIPQAAMAV